MASLTDLGKLVSTDKTDARDALIDAGLEHTPGNKGSHLYPLFRSVEILLERKEGIGKKASELNQEAQAKLNDVRRKQLERDLVPITELRQIIASFATMTSEVLDKSELSMEAQNDLVERLAERSREMFGEGGE
tara:strand:+ start:223 stop:624 length:402 start_codon:yes stop_codon:yes gene_type:complete